MPSKGIIGEIKVVRRSAQELSLEWRIPGILSLSGKNNYHYESRRFSFWNGCWRLRVWPNYSSGVWLDLVRNDSETSDKTLNVALGIKGSHGVEKKVEEKYVFSNDEGRTVKQFGLRSEFNDQKHRLIPDDVLTITCEMKIAVKIATDATTETDNDLKEPQTNEKSLGKKDVTTETDIDLTEPQTNEKSPGKKGVEELAKSLHGLLGMEEDSDVRISVGGKEFPAHRVMLRARSPVFKAMFAHDMVEKQSGVVTMEDCNPETFPEFLEHVYTGSVEMISDSNAFDLYRTSDKYDLSTLKMECTEFLKRNLTVASFCNTITLAIRHGDKDLTARATAFFCDNSLKIVETVEWQSFIQENPTVGNELFIKFLRLNQNN